jgi:flagellar basal body-associated protein FliL
MRVRDLLGQTEILLYLLSKLLVILALKLLKISYNFFSKEKKKKKKNKSSPTPMGAHSIGKSFSDTLQKKRKEKVE